MKCISDLLITYRMDISMPEPVPRGMTNIIQGLWNLSHRGKLRQLNLHSLERRLVRDMAKVYVDEYNKGDVNKVLVVEEQGMMCSNRVKLDTFTCHKDKVKKRRLKKSGG